LVSIAKPFRLVELTERAIPVKNHSFWDRVFLSGKLIHTVTSSPGNPRNVRVDFDICPKKAELVSQINSTPPTKAILTVDLLVRIIKNFNTIPF